MSIDQREFIYERVGAVFSPCRRYRYVLYRDIDLCTISEEKVVMFIGLNPSTADEVKNDPTVRKCIGFAKRWGCGRLCMTNLFAWRSTSPAKMKKVIDPRGVNNNQFLRDCAGKATIIIAAWGKHGAFLGRDSEVMRELGNGKERSIMCLDVNKDGTPRHPLYVPYDTPLFNFVIT